MKRTLFLKNKAAVADVNNVSMSFDSTAEMVDETLEILIIDD